MEIEAKIILFLQAGATKGWTAFFNALSLLGSWLGLILLLFFIYFLSKKYALTLLLTYGTGVGINYILKTLIGRERPFMVYDNIQNFSEVMGNSFPSGHAVSAVILAIFASYLVIKIAKHKFTKVATIITSIIFVAGVCLSRMYLGLHFVTDLIAGIALGGMIAILGIYLFNKYIQFERKEGR